MKLLNMKTNNAACPIYVPSAATLDFAGLANRIAWMEGDEGALIADSKWYDRATNLGLVGTISGGTLVGGADTLTTGGITRGATVFDGAVTQVSLGNVMPVNADYTICAVYKQTRAATSGILGGSAASYHSLHLTATGRLNISHQAISQYAGAVDHALGTKHRLIATWVNSTKTYTIYVDGALEATGAAAVGSQKANTDASAIIGAIPGLDASRGFGGSLFHLSLWSDAKAGADLATINAYLAEQYG